MVREKVENSQNTAFYVLFKCLEASESEGSKSRLAKAARAELCVEMRDEKLHAIVARSTC